VWTDDFSKDPALFRESGRAGGSWPDPKALAEAPHTKSRIGRKDASKDTHLRSTREVTGYHIEAADGEIGHLEDVLFDDETWEIRHLIVDTKNWWPGKKVVLRPQWINRVSWAGREIFAKMPRETIRNGPEWDPDQPVSREYELRLHKHFSYPPYWTMEK